MRAIDLTTDAKRDLDGIWLYIAENNFTAAGEVQDKIIAEVKKLAEHPGMGHFRQDVKDPRYRFWSVYSYVIAYTFDDTNLLVIRVLHGARDIGAILQ